MGNKGFTKAVVYTLGDKTSEIRDTILENTAVVEQFKFTPCTASQKKSAGFRLTVFGNYVSLDNEGTIHLTYENQTKSPNKNEINCLLAVKILKWKEDQALQAGTPNEDGEFEPSKKQLKVLKEDAEFEVLQRTFPQESKVFNMMIRKDGLVIVDANHNVAEDIIGLLRKALGSLPCFPVDTDKPVTDLLDDWIANAVNDKITLGEKAIFYTDVEGKVQVSGEPIDSARCRNYVKEGMMTTAVEFERDGMIQSLLRDNLTFDAIKFSSELEDQADGDAQGSFLLQVRELNDMVNDVLGRLKSED